MMMVRNTDHRMTMTRHRREKSRRLRKVSALCSIIRGNRYNFLNGAQAKARCFVPTSRKRMVASALSS